MGRGGTTQGQRFSHVRKLRLVGQPSVRLRVSQVRLVLDDGSSFDGRSFGARRDVAGEVVFNTGHTGYVEALTDPSYRGQILLLTYPLQGNYGVPEGPFESARIQVQGLIVSSVSARPSHHAAVKALSDWLQAEQVPAVEGIDTRALTRRLRDHGTMGAYLLDDSHRDMDAAKRTAHRIDMATVAESAVLREIVRYPGGDLTALVIDTGAKENLVRSFQSRGVSVIRCPFFVDWERFCDDVDGVVLTNGPGDPSDLAALSERLRLLFERGIPTFGICLGHQLLARAAGATTYKLKFGHRSQNQPVVDLGTQRAYVTSQNHGYAVDESSLPPDWEPWFVNLHDGTNEGIRHRYRPFRSVQFHPEGAPGPRDTAFLFDDFIRIMSEVKRLRSAGSRRLA
jgi:carbamoyl-phosphate synthase small subunit